VSVVVSGPRRVYVLLLFWQRLVDACATCPRALSSAGRALGAGDSSHVTPDCGPLCRLVLAVRLQRVLWRRLIGVRLLVLDSGPSAGVEVTLTGDPR